jgi:predicted phage terminase large subunit-like protein
MREAKMKALVESAMRDDRALWPERFPAGQLAQRRREMGTVIFNLQYQNDARLSQGSVFREEHLRYYERPPEDLAVYQGVDLAISTSRRADYFAIVTIGVSAGFEVFVLDVFRARLSFERQVRAVLQKARQFDPVRIAVEATGYQAALSQVLAGRTPLPVRQMFPHKDKLTRAWRLSALFENGKVFFGKRQEVLSDELLVFPDGDHDDLFDALEMAVSLARSSADTKFLRIPGV